MSTSRQRKSGLSGTLATTVGGTTVPATGSTELPAAAPLTRSNSAKKKRMQEMNQQHRSPMSEEEESELLHLDHNQTTKSKKQSAKSSSNLTIESQPMLHPALGDTIELTHPHTDYEQNARKHEITTTVEVGPTVREEMPNLVLLVALYMLQGIPLGLCMGSVPFLLQEKVSYTALGIFTFATWPYSLKLLWSPIVDSWYSNSFGRRKSWIVPIQCIIGLMMMWMSYFVDGWISSGSIETITIVCFVLILLVATQDIAVDGWAITLLSSKNVGYASTCQSIGQNLGFFASYTIFLALNHADFCNKFREVPSTEGLVTLPGFLFFWGVSFLLCTLYLSIFKHEARYVPAIDEDMGVRSVYSKMWRVVKLKPVRELILIMLTCRVAFTASDNLTALKLIEKGFPKENMAAMAVILFPFELITPILISRYSNANALKTWISFYPFRLFMSILGILLVWTFPSGELPYWFYLQIIVIQILYSLGSNILFVSQCAFYSQVCDESIGGTYMTLLNTITNLGSAWPKFFVFAAVDGLTCKLIGINPSASSSTHPSVDDGPCYGLLPRGLDGYYPISFFCLFLGLCWYATFKHRMLHLGTIPKKYWSCS